uniref:CARMIL C-terminal domain-containing protein n=1 Tax=Oncorhynchus tshawytscha TaxID=74940 RepID=A0A8C8I0S6_ONCTS
MKNKTTQIRSDSPKQTESVRDAVGGKIKLTLKKRVQLEVKGDKLENRVLVRYQDCFLGTHIIGFSLCSSLNTFNYLDIQGITSNKPTQLLLEYDRGQLSLKLGSVEDVDEVVANIGTCLHRIYPGLSPVKAMKKLTLMPPERTAALQSLWEDQATTDLGPCGGFSHMYWCLCDQLGLPFREEVQWDVDTIYQTQDTRELNLQDFVHLENRDLVAIILVLEYNQWFTKLSTKDYKLSTDVCEQILRVVARSSRLEEMVLENAGLRSDFAQKLANALTCNPASVLHTLNLTNNSLEDKGVSALSAQLAKLPMGLKHLNLSKTSISQKGVNSLAQALSANPAVPTTLTHLDLCGNSLRGDDLPNLYNFLGQPNSLATLDLSNSDCCLDQVSEPSSNCWYSFKTHRRCKDVPHSFKQFFGTALALSSVNLSGTKLPLEALKALLLGLGCNPNLSEVSLDLSSCELRSGGAQILEGCIAEIPNISSLDISDNGLDSDLTTLLVWLAKNRSIRHLSLGKNFNNIKSKNLSQVLDNLVHMIQEEESPLTSISLADSKLKGDLSIVLNALGSNASLTRVDISGNGMGDMGAKMLAKALQINTKLRTVMWDKNNVSLQGLQDVASALEKNQTIRFMPIPIIDAAQALKASPEKTEDALLKMERYLLRNHETRKYLQEQAYRLQQGIVTTTTQQMMDRICVKVQDHLNSLRYTETAVVQEDMKVAKNLMKDARNSKRLLPNLYHLRGSLGGMGGPPDMGGPIQDKLESMAGEMARVMDEQLQTLLQSMVDTAEGLCPHVMKRSNLHQELMKASAGRMTVPHNFITTTLLEQSGVDIINKISEVKLSVASFLSDRIVDEILESLSRSQNTLAEHLTRKAQPLLHQDSKETEVLDETVLQPEAQTQEQRQQPAESLEEMDTCVMTPKSKRKSILCRMLRPVSVAFGELMFYIPVFPLFGQLHVPLFTYLEVVSVDCTAKSFSNISRRPTLRGSSNIQEGSEKKRESRKSGFLNLIKSRTSKSEKSHGAAAITIPASATVSTVTEEPLSPKAPLRDHSEISPDRSEKPPTHEPTTEQHSESDSKGGPHGGWHFGVPVMGRDLLAEMRKMHEKMASHKKCPIWVFFVMSLSVGKPESQTSSLSPKSKPTSITTRPPALPGTKPHPGPHSLGLLSPRTSSSHSPGRHMNKYTLLIVIWRWEIRPSESKMDQEEEDFVYCDFCLNLSCCL